MARYVPFDLERVKECLTLALAIARKELDDRQSCIVAAAERAEGAEVERDKLRAALEKINAIRNSIVGTQALDWSAHIYPLVAALNDAGFVGEGYAVARARACTLIKQRDEALARVKVLESALPTPVVLTPDEERWIGYMDQHYAHADLWPVISALLKRLGVVPDGAK